MSQLNYHHLRYFRAVALEGHLGRAAQRLNVSQSALSIQIKQLEDRLGHAFFDRVGRNLVLTEAGRIALDHADRIFGAGDELLATLGQRSTQVAPLRVGALSTLSRNFQLEFLRPLLADGAARVELRSGNMHGLMADLEAMTLDVVLTTQLPDGSASQVFASQRITEQVVGLHGKATYMDHETLTDLLQNAPLILPTDSAIRTAFEGLVTNLNVQPNIVADVDDMAMVRLLAREGVGVAVAPAVVLADEIQGGAVMTAPFDLNIAEPFFAVTLPRKFPHAALAGLLDAQSAERAV